jgi:peptide/nickel transport system ATP-binding protein
MAKSVLVMYLGEDVEYAPVTDLFNDPKHPYTKELLASVPKLGHKQSGARLHTIKGAVPSLYERPTGCPFHPRCPSMMQGICDKALPPVVELDRGRRVRCFLYGGTSRA